MRVRFPLALVIVLAAGLLLPVTGLPGLGPKPVPTRVQTLDLAAMAPSGGRGMAGVDQPTAAQSQVVATKPFGLVGLSWDTPPPAGSIVKVRVREQDGWTAWLPIPWHDDHGPDPDSAEGVQARSGTDPMLTGESDAVQVWVQTPDGQAPPNAQVHLVDTDDVGVQQTSLAQASAAPGMPQIITRAQWGADESMRNRGPIYSSVVKVGFVHHTVSSSTYTADQAAAQVRNLYAWYTKGLKYSDMAYNFLVDRFGRLYEGRYGGMDRPVVGGHTAGLNNDSFAVSAMGNFEEFNPSSSDMAAIKESIAKLMAWKLGLSGRDPGGKDTLLSTGSLNSGFWEAGETATLNRVSGHKDAGNTACPGKYLYAQVPAIRARASQIFKNGGGGGGGVADIPDLITPNPVTNEFNFRGSGYGDGVGVPRAGVLGQARDGKKAAGILKHYLAGVSVGKAADDRIVRVALGTPKRAIVDSQSLGKGGGAMRVGKLAGSASTVARLQASGDSVVVERKQGKKWQRMSTAPRVRIRWAGTRTAGKLGSAPTAVRIGADVLRHGSVTATVVSGRLRLIASLRLADEYLPYLSLVPRNWPEQAQRAIAIAARSKALAAQYDSACGCHLSDFGFLGQKATAQKGYSTWRKAASGSLTLTYNGAPIDVPLFDSSGGATSNASDVWGKDVPWLKSAEDPWSLQAKNTQYASWDQQTRPQADVAKVFGLSDVARLDLRTRLTGGAVATAIATSSSGQTATITGEQLRVQLQLPSAYIARAVDPAPVSATALSASLSGGRKGTPVVAQATDTTVVALAAAYAGTQGRPLFVVGSGGPTTAVRKALRGKRMTVVGGFSAKALKTLSRVGSVRRVTAGDAPSLSLKLASAAAGSSRRVVYVVSSGNATAMASAAMAAARSRGYLLAVSKTPSATAVKFTKAHASRTVVVAGKKEISNAAASVLRKPVRLGAQNPVTRSSRLAALGPRHGQAILVDAARPMAAAAAAASRQAVLFVQGSAGKAVKFVQSSPAIAVLRSVGADPSVVSAVRRA